MLDIKRSHLSVPPRRVVLRTKPRSAPGSKACFGLCQSLSRDTSLLLHCWSSPACGFYTPPLPPSLALSPEAPLKTTESPRPGVGMHYTTLKTAHVTVLLWTSVVFQHIGPFICESRPIKTAHLFEFSTTQLRVNGKAKTHCSLSCLGTLSAMSSSQS